MKEGFIESYDKTKIYRYLWDDVEKPKGVVQIMHGLAEHAKRYEDFALFLNKSGYIVFADDHRAHGKTVKFKESLGVYEGNAFRDITLDEVFFSEQLIKEYNLPLYIFGHSFGSFICQGYIQKYSFYKKAILCGSAYMKDRLDFKFGKLVAKLTMAFKGENVPAKLIEKSSFGSYNKKFKTGTWIAENQEVADKYAQDPLCGFTMSARFYYDFFSFAERGYKGYSLDKIDKTKPILIISGKKDMVGQMGKSVQKLYKMYANLDVEGLEMKLYDGARHEILNENIKDQVYKDILNFLEK